VRRLGLRGVNPRGGMPGGAPLDIDWVGRDGGMAGDDREAARGSKGVRKRRQPIRDANGTGPTSRCDAAAWVTTD
jgi:hypothetical protein